MFEHIEHQPDRTGGPVKYFKCLCGQEISTADPTTFRNVGGEYDYRPTPKAAIIECTECKRRHKIYYRK